MDNPIKPVLLVAACALVDADGRVLIAQRPQGKAMAGLWEFPGGKVSRRNPRTDGGPRARRGDRRRNQIAASPRQPCKPHYETFHLLMPLFVCRRFWGTATPLEGQTLKWVRPKKMRDYPMPPADAPLIPFLIDLL